MSRVNKFNVRECIDTLGTVYKDTERKRERHRIYIKGTVTNNSWVPYGK